jgi:hypothetical protein
MVFAAVTLMLSIPSSPCAAGEVVSPAELKKGAYFYCAMLVLHELANLVNL